MCQVIFSSKFHTVYVKGLLLKSMGQKTEQQELFSYEVNSDRRVRYAHLLRKIREIIDFAFVGLEVAHCYGKNGQVSVDQEVILKLMFLLFYQRAQRARGNEDTPKTIGLFMTP